MTNREWLASMSDKELANWIEEHVAYRIREGQQRQSRYGNDCYIDCRKALVSWLQREHVESGDCR